MASAPRSTLSELLSLRKSEEETFEHLRSQPSMSDFSAGVCADVTGWYAEEARTEERTAALADPQRLRELHDILKATQRHRVPGQTGSGRVSPAFQERFDALEAAVKASDAPLSRSLPEERRSFLPPAAQAAVGCVPVRSLQECAERSCGEAPRRRKIGEATSACGGVADSPAPPRRPGSALGIRASPAAWASGAHQGGE